MSKIEWCDRSDWNPLRGCTRVSEGCRNCYAESIAARFSAPGQPFHGFAEKKGSEARWTGKVALIEERLTLPLRWKKPARIFVNSASDLFHENVTDDMLDRIFAVMALCPQHTFQVLTKRPERMREYCKTLGRHHETDRVSLAMKAIHSATGYGASGAFYTLGPDGWHFANVWLGTSCENQATADERIPHLLNTPAAVRWVSAEPLLGPIDFRHSVQDEGFTIDWLRGFDGSEPPIPKIDWIVAGGESGPHARPMDLEWARDIKRQCNHAGVSFFMKQLSGPNGRAIKDIAAFPADLQQRDTPA